MPKYKSKNGKLVLIPEHWGSKKVVTKDQRKKARKAERNNKKKGRK